jgi:hypothetical protein
VSEEREIGWGFLEGHSESEAAKRGWKMMNWFVERGTEGELDEIWWEFIDSLVERRAEREVGERRR